jgi:hypothetical protein
MADFESSTYSLPPVIDFMVSTGDSKTCISVISETALAITNPQAIDFSVEPELALSSSRNVAIHVKIDDLVRTQEQLDAIPSHDVAEIKRKRRRAVEVVEAAIKAVDNSWKHVWQRFKQNADIQTQNTQTTASLSQSLVRNRDLEPNSDGEPEIERPSDSEIGGQSEQLQTRRRRRRAQAGRKKPCDKKRGGKQLKRSKARQPAHIDELPDNLLSMGDLDHEGDGEDGDDEMDVNVDHTSQTLLNSNRWVNCQRRYTTTINDDAFITISALATRAREVLLAGHKLPVLVRSLTDLSWSDQESALNTDDIQALTKRCHRGDIIQTLGGFLVDIQRIQLRAKAQR